MRSPEELTTLFRERGLKVTPQRQSIFRILHDHDAHPTAEAVYQAVREEMPTVSLRTVYATLNDLAAMGELQQVDVGGGATRFDPNVGHHHHLVCTKCGQVRDVHAEYAGLRVPAGQRQGFVVDSAEVVFRGLCDQCASETKTETKARKGVDA